MNEAGLNELAEAPTVIHEDNTGAITISNKDESRPCTRHINVKYHHTRQAVAEGLVIFKYIETGQQVADGFTKPLAKVKFKAFVRLLGMKRLSQFT